MSINHPHTTRKDKEDYISSWGYTTVPHNELLAMFGPLIGAWERGDVFWLVNEIMLRRAQTHRAPDFVASAEEFQEARRQALYEGCACSTANKALCCDRSPDRIYACTRLEGHEGFHVACAGSLGPHGISCWENRCWE